MKAVVNGKRMDSSFTCVIALSSLALSVCMQHFQGKGGMDAGIIVFVTVSTWSTCLLAPCRLLVVPSRRMRRGLTLW